jgi:hypothetical protein
VEDAAPQDARPRLTMPAERWTTSPRATAAIIRAGAEPAIARAWVTAAAAQYGRRRRGPRPGYLPVQLVVDLADIARRLAAGKHLDDGEDFG